MRSGPNPDQRASSGAAKSVSCAVEGDSGGWLDQDAELLLAFEVIEELYAEETRATEIRQKQLEELTKRRQELLAR